ncbi:MAG: glycosyltransferase family 2 protein [Candidatus Alectryocaccobium sp.]
MSKAGRFIKKLKPYNIKKGFRYLKHYGLKEFLVRLQERMEPEEVPYGPWYEKHKRTEQELKKQSEKRFKKNVLISVTVPVYHTGELFLRQMIESVMDQSYKNWELCIVNAGPDDEKVREILNEYAEKDKRIRVRELAENEGIGKNTNRAFEMAEGEYVALLDHDDLLAPDALFEVACAIERSHPDIIYSDEDKVSGENLEHTQPHFKPDFNIDLLRANNYICHLLVIRKTLIDKVGGFREGFDGAQDHDFIFRCSDNADIIVHIPRILYHWRTHQASTADNPASKLYAYEAGIRAVRENIERNGEEAEVTHTKDYGFYKVVYKVRRMSLVSIIIPNKDNKDTLKKCIDSVLTKTTYDNYEIIIVENNSTQQETFDYYKELEKNSRIRVIKWEKGFNFSAINNYAAKSANGEYLLFLNNDIEVRSADWIDGMLGNAQRKDVGIVGCRLLYPDNTIQHAGVIIGIGGIAGHAFTNLPAARSGYMHRASTQVDYSAVTAACMMISKKLFEEVGGFEEKLTVAFNDIDLCLRVREKGYLVVYDAYVEMIHYESKTRGSEDSKEKVRRFQDEIEYMRTRWIDILKQGDPYYNPNLTLSKWNFSLKAN